MKKFLSAAISLLILATLTASAFAAPFTLEEVGVTIEVPEGMTGQDMTDENAYMLGIAVDDNPNLKYAYMLKYVDELEGLWIEDLTEEQGQELVSGVAASLENPVLGAVAGQEYNLLLAASGDGTQLHYISLLNGWFCDVAVGRDDGQALTEDEIKTAAALLESIQFEEYEEAVEE